MAEAEIYDEAMNPHHGASETIVAFQAKASFTGLSGDLNGGYAELAFPYWYNYFGEPNVNQKWFRWYPSSPSGRQLSFQYTEGLITEGLLYSSVSENTWHTIRAIVRRWRDGVNYRAEVILEVDGATADSASLNTSSANTAARWLTGWPWPVHEVDGSAQAEALSTGALADGWYEYTRTALGHADLSIRNMTVIFNGVVRFYDLLDDAHQEWQGTPAFYHPRIGEQVPTAETDCWLLTQPDLAFRVYTSGSRYLWYTPGCENGSTAQHQGGAAWPALRQTINGAALRHRWLTLGNIQSTGGLMTGYWPTFWPMALARPSDTGVDQNDHPRAIPTWADPTYTKTGDLWAAWLPIVYSAGLTIYPWGATALYRDVAELIGPTDGLGYEYSVGNGAVPTGYRSFDLDLAAADRANPLGTGWWTSVSWPAIPAGRTETGALREPRLIGVTEGGRGIWLDYFQVRCYVGSSWHIRMGLQLKGRTTNDTGSIFDELIHTENAVGCIDPLSGEVVVVALQDVWGGYASGTDYVVNIVRQDIQVLPEEGTPEAVAATPVVLVNLGYSATETHLIADAIMTRSGDLWFALWRMAWGGAGYTTLSLRIYRQQDRAAAPTLHSTITGVTRPIHNRARFVEDRISGELMLVYQATAGLSVWKLDTWGDTAPEEYSLPVCGTIPAPPYGAWFSGTQAQPWELRDVAFRDSGALDSWWSYAGWFKPYSTCEGWIQGLAEENTQIRGDSYPNPAPSPPLPPGLFGDPSLDGWWQESDNDALPGSVVPYDQWIEDLAVYRPDRHPLCDGTVTWALVDAEELAA